MRILFILLIISLLTGACAHRDCGHQQLTDRYDQVLNQMGLHLQLPHEKWDLSFVDKKAQDLSDLATAMLMDFKQRQPPCRPLLEKMISEQGMMLMVSLEELERRYHEGEDLPQAPEYCFHAKELIVHPQTIRSLIRHQRQETEDHRQNIIDEHSELSMHFKMFEQDFNKKG